MKQKRPWFHRVYGIMMLFFMIVAAAIAVMPKNSSLTDDEYSKTAPFTEGWHTADGTALDEASLRRINKISQNEEISVFNTLPTDEKAAQSLFFRAKNVFFSVYIDGELVYKPNFENDNAFYTSSTGTRWCSVDVTPERLGKEIELRLTAAYPSARCGVDGFRIGSLGGFVLHCFEDNLVAIITCVLLLFVGLILAVADIPINVRTQKNHELLFLGMFSVFVALWCITELHLIEFFMDDSRFMQVVSCTSLMLIPFSLLLYLDSSVGFKSKLVVPIVSGLNTFGFVFCWALHFFKIKDIHETLTLWHINIAIVAVLLVYSVVKVTIEKHKKQGAKIYQILRAVGLCSIAVAAVIDMGRYYFGRTNDGAMFVRIGMLIFTICYGSSSLESTINAVKKGVQAEFVSRLAYQDGLTGIGNRTAFEELLAELEKEKSGDFSVGIVMFDVNDLKFVNDNLGHPLGDSMIKAAADTISAAFGEEKEDCFRIGGDEFAVIIRGEDIQSRYENGMQKFEELTAVHNAAPDCEFRVSIAHGFFLYNSECGVEQVAEAYRMADKRMYETKREMKSHQSPPEEFYAGRIKAVRS